jgi:hypothetical protein
MRTTESAVRSARVVLVSSFLTQLVYVSRATPDLDRQALEKIVARSARRNADRGITGVLLSCGRQFMQLLEGDAETLAEVYRVIASDPRHADVELLVKKQVDRRLYPEWGMELIDLRTGAKLDRARLLSLVTELQTRYNTARYSAEARMLLSDFRQQLAS